MFPSSSELPPFESSSSFWSFMGSCGKIFSSACSNASVNCSKVETATTPARFPIGFAFRPSRAASRFSMRRRHTSSFTLNTINFEFLESGSIGMKYSINSFSSEVYATSDDFVRLCMEVLFIFLSLVNLGTELSEIVVAKIETGHFRTYFKSFWNYVDLANLLLFFWSSWFWVLFVRALAMYEPRERWEVLER